MSLKSVKYDTKSGDLVLHVSINGVKLDALPDSKSGKTLMVASSNGAVQTTVENASGLGTIRVNLSAFANK